MQARDAETVPLWKRLLIGRRPKRTLLRATITATLLLVTFHFILLPARVTGKSMEPTYMDRSVTLINRYAYRWSRPKRGDIVAVKTTGEHNLFLKRVVGLPGETVEIRSGTVYINEEPLAEPYVRFSQQWNDPPKVVEPDKYLLIGDNRGMPKDWHTWGQVWFSSIAGKAVW